MALLPFFMKVVVDFPLLKMSGRNNVEKLPHCDAFLNALPPLKYRGVLTGGVLPLYPSIHQLSKAFPLKLSYQISW